MENIAKMENNIRKAEYAGLYYPSDPQILSDSIEQLIGECGIFGPNLADLKVNALIVPSAGYSYSGKIAASAYRELYGRKFKKVVVIGSSKFINFDGVALSRADYFETPLGKVKTDQSSTNFLASKMGFNFNDLAFAKDYTIEIQLPFLQKVLGEFELIPLMTSGKTDFKVIAEEISDLIDDEVLIVISSNLSHFLEDKKARNTDQSLIEAITELNSRKIIERGEASALFAIVTLNEIAKFKNWTPIFLTYSNSAEAGDDPASVVGYGSLIYFSA